MACKVDLSNVIVQEAQAQGVDPGIALAVARTESGVCQWRPDGSVVTSSAGAIGVMQLMPATAAALGVDPYDVNQNIRGGVAYLKQLFNKYGSWDSALAAYNWGPGKVDSAASSGGSWPAEVFNYVKGILGIGTVYNSAIAQTQNAPAATVPQTSDLISSADILGAIESSPNVALIGGLAIGGLALVMWLWDD